MAAATRSRQADATREQNKLNTSQSKKIRFFEYIYTFNHIFSPSPLNFISLRRLALACLYVKPGFEMQYRARGVNKLVVSLLLEYQIPARGKQTSRAGADGCAHSTVCTV